MITGFDPDGAFVEAGGHTKPTLQNADMINYQTVVNVRRRELWMKIPSPTYFADLTQFYLMDLWT